jgi:hypothetical protein
MSRRGRKTSAAKDQGGPFTPRLALLRPQKKKPPSKISSNLGRNAECRLASSQHPHGKLGLQFGSGGLQHWQDRGPSMIVDGVEYGPSYASGQSQQG